MPPSHLPTHADIAAFFLRYLPVSANAREVPFVWHSPRYSTYDPARQYVTAVVLSITPTPGFYTANNDQKYRQVPASFLHRPWALDRRSLIRNSYVLSSHASFDEHLTVGWSTALAARLQLDLGTAVRIQGYKDNPDRKIGLLAQLKEPTSLADLSLNLREEYQGVGDLHVPERILSEQADGPKIRTVAIMNAFHAEEIDRVLAAAREQLWISPEEDGRSILYLTGAARDYGLEAIKLVNMPAYCVGHRACEEWGIRYLAAQLRLAWPVIDVVEVLEEEEVVQKQHKPRNERQMQMHGDDHDKPLSTA